MPNAAGSIFILFTVFVWTTCKYHVMVYEIIGNAPFPSDMDKH